ncbi:ankyrin repeat domain-containing protein [Myxococcus landrumensis]|uniref:Ankyrin repeat domain-containing protein n=1 Tax=Myxococcus landrumensis TaxID=2813577 RepID=A0ABX7N0P8_9BACT|nr:ankyrin repeat domain-containing protein [Myxococcus landrumus]QSQ12285.1 ankyrin repeat domain-containing protein [Myxococcus landrumus]
MRPWVFRVLSSSVVLCLVVTGSAFARNRRRSAVLIEDTPVIQAALDGDAAKMKALLRHKASVNRTGELTNGLGHMTPLMVASEKGHTAIVDLLLQAKADPDLRVPRHSASWPPPGWSARCFARAERQSGPEALLVQAGASGDAACLVEADFLAAVRKKDSKRALLLGRRAKGGIRQQVLQEALDLAREQKSIAMIRAVDAAGFNPGATTGVHIELPVASRTDVSMSPGSHILVTALSPARKALEARDEKAVLALVKAGHPPPMLMMLVRWGMTSVVLHQLKTGANPDVGEEAGNTPLIEAVLARNQVLVDALLAAGADVNLPGEVEVTPLLAALQGDKPVELSLVGRLLKAKADVNKADRYRTPLMEAASRCLPKVVSLLLQKGARWDVPPDGGAGLYEEAVVPRVPCSEEVTVQVIQALREGGVPLQHPEERHLDWLRLRARESPVLGPELSAAGLRPEKEQPSSPPDAAR